MRPCRGDCRTNWFFGSIVAIDHGSDLARLRFRTTIRSGRFPSTSKDATATALWNPARNTRAVRRDLRGARRVNRSGKRQTRGEVHFACTSGTARSVPRAIAGHNRAMGLLISVVVDISPKFGIMKLRNQDMRTGSHSTHGFLIAAGDGIARDTTLANASIYDIAPTILTTRASRSHPRCKGRPLFSR